MKSATLRLCLLGVAVFFAVRASAQEVSATLRGTVTDPSGAGVSGAQVKAIQAETGLQRAAVSDGQAGEGL